MTDISNKSCSEFVRMLASKEPVPGGGGVAALIGAIGVALSSMVTNLTLGKKKYAEYNQVHLQILHEAKLLEKELVNMVDEDAKCFLPLSQAYGLPNGTQEEKIVKQETMEKALKMACEVPVNIIKMCYEALKLHEKLINVGSRLLISDIGAGVQCLRSSMLSAKLCVFINTDQIKDTEYVNKVEEEVTAFVDSGVKICDKIYEEVENIILKQR